MSNSPKHDALVRACAAWWRENTPAGHTRVLLVEPTIAWTYAEATEPRRSGHGLKPDLLVITLDRKRYVTLDIIDAKVTRDDLSKALLWYENRTPQVIEYAKRAHHVWIAVPTNLRERARTLLARGADPDFPRCGLLLHLASAGTMDVDLEPEWQSCADNGDLELLAGVALGMATNETTHKIGRFSVTHA